MSDEGLMNKLKATQQLPENYHKIDELDLNNNRGLSMILTLTGIGLLFGVSWLLLESLTFLRPEYLSTENILVITGMREFWRGVLLLIVSMGLMTVLYSGVRWLMFLIVTRQHPTLRVRGFSAYTTAPAWYIPRRAYLLISLTPVVLITLFGVAAIPIVPLNFVPGVMLVVSLNFAAAINDIVTAYWLLRRPKDILIQSYRDGVRVFGTSQQG
jgi:hypothetical protein